MDQLVKKFACNAGDHGSIPGLGRSPGEGTGYPLQNSWPSLVAQMVGNLPAMWETWVQSLGWEDPLEEGTATHSSILAWRIPWKEEPSGLQSIGSQSRTRLSNSAQHRSRELKARDLWPPRGLGRGGRWERGSRERGHIGMPTAVSCWWNRNQHSIVKPLSSN